MKGPTEGSFFIGHMSVEHDKPVEHCGVVGAIDFKGTDVVRRTIALLSTNQHRGQDGAGILTINHGFHHHKGVGLVNQIFSRRKMDSLNLVGSLAIGHNRYKTQGGDGQDFLQPIIAEHEDRKIGLAHNGNIPETGLIRKQLEEYGVCPDFKFDSEGLAKLIVAAPGLNWMERVQNALQGIHGSYALTIATMDGNLLAVRDPAGNRPLSYAYTQSGIFVSSESKGLRTLKAESVTEVAPGEIVSFSDRGNFRSFLLDQPNLAICALEMIYFMHEHSRLDGYPVAAARRELGHTLAVYHPGDGSEAGFVPDSSAAAGGEYAFSLRKRDRGLVRRSRNNTKRSFIEAEMRADVVETKYEVSDEFEGMVVDLVDDSIIRGTTARGLIQEIKYRGGEVNLLSTAPKVVRGCDFGINMGSQGDEYIAIDSNGNLRSNEEIALEIGAKSVNYNTLEDVAEALSYVGANIDNYCVSCFGGRSVPAPTLRSVRPNIERLLDPRLSLQMVY